MSLRINTNIDALTAYNNLNKIGTSLSTSLERLSSGLRINKAADDAAGLAISQGLTRQVNGLGQAIANAQDGINFVQTADGALTEVSAILQRARTLTIQASNGTQSTTSRAAIQTEMTQIFSEINRIANATDFNGTKLLSGSASTAAFTVGSDKLASVNSIQVELGSAGISAALTLTGADFTAFSAAALSGTAVAATADAVLTKIDAAIDQVDTKRAVLGATQNRLQHTINNISVTQTNLAASNSSILDADMATEMSNYTRSQILQQAGTSMLRQANLASQSVLTLLQ